MSNAWFLIVLNFKCMLLFFFAYIFRINAKTQVFTYRHAFYPPINSEEKIFNCKILCMRNFFKIYNQEISAIIIQHFSTKVDEKSNEKFDTIFFGDDVFSKIKEFVNQKIKNKIESEPLKFMDDFKFANYKDKIFDSYKKFFYDKYMIKSKKDTSSMAKIYISIILNAFSHVLALKSKPIITNYENESGFFYYKDKFYITMMKHIIQTQIEKYLANTDNQNEFAIKIYYFFDEEIKKISTNIAYGIISTTNSANTGKNDDLNLYEKNIDFIIDFGFNLQNILEGHIFNDDAFDENFGVNFLNELDKFLKDLCTEFNNCVENELRFDKKEVFENLKKMITDKKIKPAFNFLCETQSLMNLLTFRFKYKKDQELSADIEKKVLKEIVTQAKKKYVNFSEQINKIFENICNCDAVNEKDSKLFDLNAQNFEKKKEYNNNDIKEPKCKAENDFFDVIAQLYLTLHKKGYEFNKNQKLADVNPVLYNKMIKEYHVLIEKIFDDINQAYDLYIEEAPKQEDKKPSLKQLGV